MTLRGIVMFHAIINRKVEMLCMDTGCSKSVVTRGYCEEKGLEIRELERPMGASNMAGGPASVVGVTTLEVKIMGEEFAVDCHVLDGNHFSCLIGTEVMEQYGVIINFRNHSLRFWKQGHDAFVPFSLSSMPIPPPSKSREMSTEQVKCRVGNPRMKPKKGTSTPRPPSPSPLPPVDQEPLTGARKEVRLKLDAILPPHSATDVKLIFYPTLSHNDLYFQSQTDFASSVHLFRTPTSTHNLILINISVSSTCGGTRYDFQKAPS
ncbi:hypothetical protein BT69DRAFT_607404 [Atractiella rhizophila]|nr:hypothetical protein BT69DRAFT_607404 [Atractiella rhizophila]